jgi:pilus assembly protein Flp/PilA
MHNLMLEMASLLSPATKKSHSSPEEGQGMIEYGLLVALISIAAVAVIVLIGPQLSSTFQTIVNAL